MEWKYRQMMIDQGDAQFVENWSDEKEKLCSLADQKYDFMWEFNGDEVVFYDRPDTLRPVLKFKSINDALDFFEKEKNGMFKWTMPEDYFERVVSAYQEDNIDLVDECVGQLRFGEICFDCVVRGYDDRQTLTMDMYVYGVNHGDYAYAADGVPYSYEDGFDFHEDWIYDLSFETFKLVAQAMAYQYAKDIGFNEKANKEYKEW